MTSAPGREGVCSSAIAGAPPAPLEVRHPLGSASAAQSLPARKAKPRQDNIDLLRAIAIIVVVIYHYTTRNPPRYYLTDAMPFTFEWGHHGVSLFFIVSGFCIFMTLDSSRSLENFWARRIARIQPAYMVAIVITFAVVSAAGLPSREVSPLVALSNMAWLNMIPNWPDVDSAYWSLVVELKFYILIGLVYYAMRGRNITMAWAALSLAAMGLHHLGGLAEAIGDQIFIAPLCPFFLTGLFAWEYSRLDRGQAIAIAVATFMLLILTPRMSDYPATGPLMAVAAFLVLRSPGLKVPKPITLIGLVSYSLYLLHQNIGYVLIRALPFRIEVDLALTALIVLSLSVALYVLVERRWERRFQQWAEGALGSGRRRLRLPRRQFRHPTIEEQMREW